MHNKIDLKAHIAKLKAKEAASPSSLKADDTLLFWGTSLDKEYLPYLKSCVGSATTLVRLEKVETLTQVTMYCKQRGITRIISSSISLLKKVLKWDKRAAPSLDSYAGSYFKLEPFKEGGEQIEVVFIKPLKQLVTVPHGKFTTSRNISKLTQKEKWDKRFKPTPFKGFEVLKPENEEVLFWEFSTAFLISIDIETLRENATIRCISYTAFFSDMSSSSVVLPLDSEYALAIMRKWNWELKAPKIGQNFKYDLSYLARYSAPVYNYLYDTATLFHCWYTELPKDLGFLNSFFIREAFYWKDLANTNDLHEYYKYNALDTWGTGNCFLAMMLEVPDWAISNYLLEFPLLFPCHLSEMTGIARDMESLHIAKAEQDKIIADASKSLNTILAIPEGQTFNVNSSIQMKSLLKILGCADLKSADAKNLSKARFRHPLNARIISLVLTIRKARKLVSTYITPGKEFTRQDGTGHRILYSLNPHGTDTSRLASKEHHFWCGLQVQNIPRGPAVKRTLKADPGFLMAEVDLEQAESRDTAYISGDAQLIENVENSPDFHCSNASSFFGVPFEEMYDTEKGVVLNKDLRNLGKPVNHGANYNMGAYILIETMGEENIQKAKRLLSLPKMWSYMQVAEYLLEQFHKTYPAIKKVFYAGVVEEILTTGKIISQAFHHEWFEVQELKTNLSTEAVWKGMYEEHGSNAWTRYCFSDPSKSKQALNAYIAHPPQSLNAQTLNKSYLSVFHDIAIHPKHRSNFKLCAQIHDSILFQYRKGHEYLCEMVRQRMEVPVTLQGYDKVIRTFVVPAGVKKGDHLEGADKGRATHWSMTE